MKVLICIPCLLSGGTEIQTLNLIKALSSGGHKVTTLCYFEHYENMIERYKKYGSNVICLSKDGRRIGGLKGIILLFKGFKKTIKNYKPDVVHVQYMAPGAIPILILKLLGVKNVITTAHTVADIYSNLNLVHFIQKYCVRVFTCITLKAEESFFGSSQLYTSSTVLNKRNHFTVYNTLPSYINITDKHRDYNKNTITLGVVSRLESIKGMDLVIPAFSEVKKHYPDIRLIVVGDGSSKTQMEKQRDDLNLNKYIEFVGRQIPEKLQDYYDIIDILLIPSRSEGFGLTAIEGMARGCVVLASDTGGLPEVIENGKVGILHKTGDINDLVNKICYLINNKKFLDSISKTAIEYVKKFSFDTYSKLINDLYRKLN